MVDHIDVELPDGTAEAYVARPSAEGSHPGVLFFIDAIGLRPRIAEMAQRIADWGYVVLAPNVLWRSGTAEETSPAGDLHAPGAREEFFTGAMERVKELTPHLAEADIPVYLAALRHLEGVSEGPVGVIGYCMGARLALRAARLDPLVGAVGGFHGGGLVTDDERSPHRGLEDSRAEFLFGHADQDRSMPPQAIATLEEVLLEAGRPVTSAIYEGAPHGYSMSDTPMYDEAATERHFRELEALLDRAL
jgi:carboxymethylenebutenolidase